MAEEQRIDLLFDASDEYRPEPPQPPEIPAWKDGSQRIGIHTSIAGDICGALELAQGLGATALQIFSASRWCDLWHWARIFWWRIRDVAARTGAFAIRFTPLRREFGKRRAD